MISKISIQNIASYKAATILATDKKVNVVYGLNGSGKSTLSNYLYQPEAPEYHGCSVDMANDASLYVYNQCSGLIQIDTSMRDNRPSLA